MYVTILDLQREVLKQIRCCGDRDILERLLHELRLGHLRELAQSAAPHPQGSAELDQQNLQTEIRSYSADHE